MISKNRNVIWVGLICVISIWMFALQVAIPSSAQEKLNFKQAWMVWDERNWPTKPVSCGYFRVAAPKYVGLMNPNHWPVNDWNVIGDLYEEIFYVDGELKPSVAWLAEHWEYEDQVTVLMKLRKGIQFHDGTDFNASSVKYQMEWIMDRKNGCWSRSWLNPIETIEVVDDYTIRWQFKRPWASFIGSVLAYVPGYMMSTKSLKGEALLKEAKKIQSQAKNAKKALARAEKKEKKAASKGGEKAKKAAAKAEKARKKARRLEKKAEELTAKVKGINSLDTHPVGTGAYMLEDANPGNYLKLKRNPNWWFGKAIGYPDMPYFDGVIYNIIPDPSVQLANLKAGKIDQMKVDKSQYVLVKDNPDLTVHVYPTPDTRSLFFNMAEGPCKDIRVRKAISHAIDRKALIAGIQFGLARVASCFFPEEHWCHNPDLKPVSYDPELSKRLLAEAGYKDKLTLKGGLQDSTMERSLAEAIKSMLAQVGIDWKVVLLDPVADMDRLRNREYDLGGVGWNYIYEPDAPLTGLYTPTGGANYGRSHNEKAMGLIKTGRAELDMDKRQNIYYQLEKVLYENYEDVWLWWDMAIVALRKNVYGRNQELYLKGRESYYQSHPLWFKDGHP